MIRPTAWAGLLATLQVLAPAPAQETDSPDRYQLDFNGLRAPVDARWLTDDRLVILESAPPAIRITDWLECSTATDIDCGEPAGLAIGPDDTILVTDAARNRILQLAPDGTTVRIIEPSDGLRHPTGIAMHDGHLYVADTGNDRIAVLDLDGTLLRSIGSRGVAPGRFRRPQGLDIDAADRSVVADTDNHRIQTLDLDGTPISHWGSWGSFPGLFQAPSDVHCIDDRIFVSDRLNHRIQLFRSDGTLVDAWGMHSVKPREGQGRIHYPDALAISPDGSRLAVVESFEDRIQFFGGDYPDWIDEETRREIESRPTTAPRTGIQSHFGPTVDLDDRIMVVWEPEARAVLIFDHQRQTPIRLTSIFSRGDGPGGFGHLADLHWDHDSNQLHLFDRGTSQVHVYGLELPPADQPRFDPSMARLLTSRTLDASIPMHRIVDAERAGNGR
ncbi:MAG: NHL repeat-containing protein, partial [Planctomycetota bacterium]|nr:NHL repeat-containing protein [Planctomycetota bacterium]